MNRHDHEGRAECLHPRFGKRGDVERPADRRRGDSTREMHQIADESPRPGERKISPFRFVHPCTSRGLRRRSVDRLRPISLLRGAGSTRVRCDPDRANRSLQEIAWGGKAKLARMSREQARAALAERTADGLGRIVSCDAAPSREWISQSASRMP